MTVGTITNSHFPPETGWSLQVDPAINKAKRYTPNEGVLVLDRVALTARSDRAVTNGGTAVVYLVELPGLGKSGGTFERPKLTQVLLLGARQ
eukprot:4615143-Pleurochrysis_carterae.AAC.1